jgi:hypothetical protein
MRYTYKDIQEKMQEYGCHYTLSWSKLNTFVEDPFSFYLKYIKGIKEEKQNAYAYFGDIVHHGIEDFYDGKDMKDVIDTFEKKFLEQSMSTLKFVSDEEKNKKIEEDYYNCIKHFFHNYNKVSKLSKLEQFACLKIDDYFMNGYIDHMYPLVEEIETDQVDEAMNVQTKTYVVIEDFKTSTLYQGKKIEQNAGQLKLYAYMVHKMYNVPIENLKAGWNFLKYVSIDIKQINGNIRTSKVLRNAIPEALESKIKSWGKKLKYTPEEIETFLNTIRENANKFQDVNITQGLPDNIADKFKIRDCFVEVPLSEKILEEFIDYVKQQIQFMDDKMKLYEITEDSNLFWTEINKDNEFYFLNLCGFTSKYHLPLRKYLENLQTFEKSSVKNKDSKELEDDILSLLFKDN